MQKQKVVFVTGWGQRAGGLADLAEALSEVAHPVLTSVYELIESEPPESRALQLSPSRYALGLEQLLPDEKVALVGASTGGLVCLETALRHPERVDKLVLLSSTACFLQAPDDPEYPGVKPVMLRAMMLGLQGAKKLTLKRFFNLMFSPSNKAHQSKIADLVEEAGSLDTALLLHGLRYLEQQDLRTSLPKLELPVLLLHGTQDQVIPLESAEWALGQLPNGRLEKLENGTHALIETECAWAAEKVRAFLEQ